MNEREKREVKIPARSAHAVKGITAKIYSVQVAVEHNFDGSVTVCKELVDDILADEETSDFVRHVFLAANENTRFGKVHKIK